jgi:tRNA(fMet)-specific endonuclease VapC
MPRFMLDADTVSYAIRGRGRVAAELLRHRPSELCLSSITLAEIQFGAEAKRSQKLRHAIRNFVKDMQVLPFDEPAAVRFAVVAAALGHKGTPIGSFDTLVAAHALSLGLTVITNNTKHFSRVPGLKLENWA